MAIFASTSTITTQTVPLIIVDPATITQDYLLVWDETVGAFIAKIPDFPNFYNIDIGGANITGVLPIQNGGTGISEYNKGDMLYANDVGGEIVLDKLPIGTGSYDNVLTTVDGLPTWASASNIKNIVVTRSVSVSTVSGNVGPLTPENTQLLKITILVTIPYNIEATMSIGTDIANSEILNSTNIILSKVGQYVYAIDSFYANPMQLFYNIENATTGAAKIIVEFVSQ
jgi:hypothetical protein